MEIIKHFEDNNVRVILINKEPYFAATDVCKILDIGNAPQAVSTLEKDDVISNDTIDSLGRRQTINFINEGGLYHLIFKSKKQSAKKFKRWVTHEVLPSLRKTGKYSIPGKLRKDSTKNRNLLTSEWQNHGIKNPNEFIQLTLKEYRSLEFQKGKRKKDFSKEELLLLNALESMESLKLFKSSEIEGLDDCKNSLGDTVDGIKKIVNN